MIVYVAYNRDCRDGHILHTKAAYDSFVDGLDNVVGWVFSVMRAPSPFDKGSARRWRGRAGFGGAGS